MPDSKHKLTIEALPTVHQPVSQPVYSRGWYYVTTLKTPGNSMCVESTRTYKNEPACLAAARRFISTLRSI